MQNDRYTMIPFNYMPKCSQEHVLLMGIRTCMGKMIHTILRMVVTMEGERD